jgi:voltage-gated potassium channel
MADDAPVSARDRWLQRWEHYTEYPLFVLSLAFLVGMIMVIESGSNAEYAQIGQQLMTLSWLAFLCDYVVRFALTRRRVHFVTHNVLQGLAVLVPPLRILLIGKVFDTMATGAQRKFGGRVRIYALYLTTLTIVISAVLVTTFERNAPGANIRSFGDALWWTTETVSTVGYGDYYPVTLGGRIVAVALFVNGIALLSAVTATIASKVLGSDDSTSQEPEVNVSDLHDRLARIESQLNSLVSQTANADVGPDDGNSTAAKGSSPSF